jgi:hypothetical protein
MIAISDLPVPRKSIGDRPLTTAERQARIRARRAGEVARYHAALVRVMAAKTVREARLIALEALAAP